MKNSSIDEWENAWYMGIWASNSGTFFADLVYMLWSLKSIGNYY